MAKYEFILCESPDPKEPFQPLHKIGPLVNIQQPSYTLIRNRAGSFNFNIRTKDPMAYKILDLVDLGDVRGTVRKCVRIRRNDVDLWEGPIWTIDGNLPDGLLSIGCVGWLETLQKRILWSTLDYSNSGFGTPTDQIIFGLLRIVDSQDLNHRLLIKPGLTYGVMPNRNRFYVLGTQVGPTVQELSDIEDGVDYVVRPGTRDLDLYAWDHFAVRANVHLGFGTGPGNISRLTWQENAAQTCNSMVLISQGANVGPVVDVASQDQYNLFEEYVTLTSANQAVLAPFGEAELAIRSRPMVTYTIVPKASTAPKLFEDFDIGDMIDFSAKQDAFKIDRQKIRVFGATVSIDTEGNETVTSLQVAPATG